VVPDFANVFLISVVVTQHGKYLAEKLRTDTKPFIPNLFLCKQPWSCGFYPCNIFLLYKLNSYFHFYIDFCTMYRSNSYNKKIHARFEAFRRSFEILYGFNTHT